MGGDSPGNRRTSGLRDVQQNAIHQQSPIEEAGRACQHNQLSANSHNEQLSN